MSNPHGKPGQHGEQSHSGAVPRQTGSFGVRPRSKTITGAVRAVDAPAFGAAAHDEPQAETAVPDAAPRAASAASSSSFLSSLDGVAASPTGSFKAPSSGAIGRQTGGFSTVSGNSATAVDTFSVPPSGLVARTSGALDGVTTGSVPRASGGFTTQGTHRASGEISGARTAAPSGAFRVAGPNQTQGSSDNRLPSGTAGDVLSGAMKTLKTVTRAMESGQGDAFELWGQCALAIADVAAIRPEYLPADRHGELTVVRAGLSDTEYDLRNAARASFPDAEELAAVVRAQLDVERVAAERGAPLINFRRTHSLSTLEQGSGSAALAEALARHAKLAEKERERTESRSHAWPMGMRIRMAEAETKKPTLDLARFNVLEPQIPRLFAASGTHPTDRMLQALLVVSIVGSVLGFVYTQMPFVYAGILVAVVSAAVLFRRESLASEALEQAVAMMTRDRLQYDARLLEGRIMERLLADLVAAERTIPAVYHERIRGLESNFPLRYRQLRELVSRGVM